MIFVFSIARDAHVERLLKCIPVGVSVEVFNTSDLGDKSDLSFGFAGQILTSSFRIGRKIYSFNPNDTIWVRKPFFELDKYLGKNNKELAMKRFKHIEIRNLLISQFLQAERLNIFMVNPISRLIADDYKPFQLKVASEIGLNVPDTIISSNKNEVHNFLVLHSQAIIKGMGSYTPYYDGKVRTVTTNKIDLTYFDSYYKKANLDYPVFIQEMVPKKFELRITVIGKKLFACAIYSQENPKTLVDWRSISPYKLKHEAITLPFDIETKCFELIRRLGLQYGAIDMIVTPDGRYVFLENNPAGQYLWIEDITKMPLSQVMADLLVKPEENKLT